MFDMCGPLVLHLFEIFHQPHSVLILDLFNSFLVLSEFTSVFADLLDDMAVDMFIIMIDTSVHTLTVSLELDIQLINR